MSRADQILKFLKRADQAVPAKGVAKDAGRYPADVPILHEGIGQSFSHGGFKADDFPLERPHVGKELPLTADNPEDLQKLKELVHKEKTVDVPSKLSQEFADRARPDAVKHLKSSQSDVTKTDKIPTSGLVGKTVQALQYPQKKLLGAIGSQLGLKKEKQPDEQATDIAEKVADKLGVPVSGLPGILTRTGIATATEFGLDPLNFVGMPVKGMSKAVQKAPGVLGAGKQAAEKSIEALARKMRANQAMSVLSKPKAQSVAEKMAAEGAEIVVPRGKIVRSRP